MWMQLFLPRTHDTSHPLYVMQMRRRRWWRSDASVPAYFRYVALWSMAFWLSLYLIYVVSFTVHELYSFSTPFRSYTVLDDLVEVLLWAGGISIGLSYLFDFYTMGVAVNAINGERRALRWDLLHLTPLPMQSIVTAIYDAVQMRLWRLTAFLVGVRAAVVVAFWLLLFVINPVLSRDDMLRDMWRDPLETLLILSWLSVLFWGFMLEPVWRMRSMVALAMGISSRFRRMSTALMVAFPLMVLVWVAMLGALWASLFAVFWVDVGYGTVEQVYALFVALFIMSVVYWLFNVVRLWGLQWALRRATVLYEPWTFDDSIPRPMWWYWWQPHGGVSRENPLLVHQARHLRWWHGVHSPVGVGLWMMAWAMWVTWLVLLVGALWLWHRNVGFVAMRSMYSMSNWVSESVDVAIYVLQVVVVLTIPFAGVAMLGALRQAQRWVRVRDAYALVLHPFDAWLGVRAVVLTRMWRWVMLWTGVRLGMVVTGVAFIIWKDVLEDYTRMNHSMFEFFFAVVVMSIVAALWPLLAVRAGGSLGLLLAFFVGRRRWWWLAYGVVLVLVGADVMWQGLLMLELDSYWDWEELVAMAILYLATYLMIDRVALAIIKWRATIRAAK